MISIIVPTYNEEGYISDLLESVKGQGFDDYEVLLVDSFSRDKTVKIARSYGARVFYSKRGNIAASKNVGIRHANGNIVAFIDADVILSKNVLKSVHDTFTKDRLKRIVAIEPAHGSSKAGIRKNNFIKFLIVSKFVNLWKRITFLSGWPAATNCVFSRKDAVKSAGFFNEKIRISEDREYYQRLRKFGRFVIIPEKGWVSYRRQEREGLILPALTYLKGDFLAFASGKVKKGMKPER